MSSNKIDPDRAPRWQWAIVGQPATGKSIFAMQMRGLFSAMDADHRTAEVAALAARGTCTLSDRPTDNMIVDPIAAQLRANVLGSDMRTIVVESLTAILCN